MSGHHQSGRQILQMRSPAAASQTMLMLDTPSPQLHASPQFTFGPTSGAGAPLADASSCLRLNSLFESSHSQAHLAEESGGGGGDCFCPNIFCSSTATTATTATAASKGHCEPQQNRLGRRDSSLMCEAFERYMWSSSASLTTPPVPPGGELDEPRQLEAVDNSSSNASSNGDEEDGPAAAAAAAAETTAETTAAVFFQPHEQQQQQQQQQRWQDGCFAQETMEAAGGEARGRRLAEQISTDQYSRQSDSARQAPGEHQIGSPASARGAHSSGRSSECGASHETSAGPLHQDKQREEQQQQHAQQQQQQQPVLIAHFEQQQPQQQQQQQRELDEQSYVSYTDLDLVQAKGAQGQQHVFEYRPAIEQDYYLHPGCSYLEQTGLSYYPAQEQSYAAVLASEPHQTLQQQHHQNAYYCQQPQPQLQQLQDEHHQQQQQQRQHHVYSYHHHHHHHQTCTSTSGRDYYAAQAPKCQQLECALEQPDKTYHVLEPQQASYAVGQQQQPQLQYACHDAYASGESSIIQTVVGQQYAGYELPAYQQPAVCVAGYSQQLYEQPPPPPPPPPAQQQQQQQQQQQLANLPVVSKHYDPCAELENCLNWASAAGGGGECEEDDDDEQEDDEEVDGEEVDGEEEGERGEEEDGDEVASSCGSMQSSATASQSNQRTARARPVRSSRQRASRRLAEAGPSTARDEQNAGSRATAAAPPRPAGCSKETRARLRAFLERRIKLKQQVRASNSQQRLLASKASATTPGYHHLHGQQQQQMYSYSCAAGPSTSSAGLMARQVQMAHNNNHHQQQQQYHSQPHHQSQVPRIETIHHRPPGLTPSSPQPVAADGKRPHSTCTISSRSSPGTSSFAASDDERPPARNSLAYNDQSHKRHAESVCSDSATHGDLEPIGEVPNRPLTRRRSRSVASAAAAADPFANMAGRRKGSSGSSTSSRCSSSNSSTARSCSLSSDIIKSPSNVSRQLEEVGVETRASKRRKQRQQQEAQLAPPPSSAQRTEGQLVQMPMECN